MASFQDAAGAVHQLPLAVTMYREAEDRGMSLAQYVNATYPTNAEVYGSTFQQLLASEGLFLRANRELGIRPSTMLEVLEGRPQAGTNVKDAVPASRILFPAVIMQVIEDKLVANLEMNAAAFDGMIAYEESITGDRYEQPVINMAKPEAARSLGISQLASPPAMMTLTTSDKAYRIPTFSIGLEVSDQALKATTLDFVAMSLARQAAVERNERAQNYMLALYNGDVDNGDGTLSSLGLVDAATSFDAAATGLSMTQKCWMKFLMKNGKKRTISHIVTDIDTAMKIENRTGKPNVMTDDPKSPRIDTTFKVANPTWATNPIIFLTDDPAWPANTIMALDKQWAIRRVRNLGASYQATEAYVMRRSQALRIDFGEHVNRMYNDAFAGLTLSA